MSHDTISYEDFCSLRAGDLIVWRKKYLRSIISGPADKPARCRNPSVATVELPIRHRSWTGRMYTIYCFHALRDKIAVADKRIRTLLLPSEAEVLAGAGFNLRPDLLKELNERAAYYARSGKSPCAAFARIQKLASRGQ